MIVPPTAIYIVLGTYWYKKLAIKITSSNQSFWVTAYRLDFRQLYTNFKPLLALQNWVFLLSTKICHHSNVTNLESTIKT